MSHIFCEGWGGGGGQCTVDHLSMETAQYKFGIYLSYFNVQDLPRSQGSCLKVLLKLIYLRPHQFETKEIITVIVAGNLILISVDFYGFIFPSLSFSFS